MVPVYVFIIMYIFHNAERDIVERSADDDGDDAFVEVIQLIFQF